jgi:hypothetical protein
MFKIDFEKYKVQQYEFKYPINGMHFSKAKKCDFPFHRDFMEYHEERFHDYSLIFEEDKLIAVLPANRVSDTVYPQGLTYGGLFIKKQTKLISLLDVFSAVLSF